MGNEQYITVPYKPRTAFIGFHGRTDREAELVCHRRAGKTVAICNDLQRKCVSHPRKFPPPRFAWFYPTRVRAKDIAWPYLKYYSECVPGRRVIESELAIEYPPNGGRVTLYGADNSRGVGLWLDGVAYDECDEIPRTTIAEVAPTLSDYQGWTVKAGMLRGRYNLWKWYSEGLGMPGHFSLLLKASETKIIAEEELARLRNTMGEAAYQMQLECNASASIANAIYGAEMDRLRKDGRLKVVAADPMSPLWTFWDIGHSDRGDDWTIWLAQMANRDILLLEYFANTGRTPGFYAAKVREWEDKYANRVAMNYLPHDAKNRNQKGLTTLDYLKEAGLDRCKAVPRTPDIWRSIEQMRGLFPGVYINAPGCSQTWMLGEAEMPSGVDCLDFYTKKQDETTGIITDVPVHNQYSHGADAIRTFAEAYSQGMLDGTSVYAQKNPSQSIHVTRTAQTQVGAFRQLNITR